MVLTFSSHRASGLALLVAVAAATPPAHHPVQHPAPRSHVGAEVPSGPTPLEQQFSEWKTTFFKVYASDAEEYQAFVNWKGSQTLLEAHNAQPLPFTLGHNHFSDMSPIEFRTSMLTPDLMTRKLVLDQSATKKMDVHKKGDYGLKEMLPQTVDWGEKGAVTEVDDQGMCAGSWAFAMVSTVESAHYIASGMKEPVTRLSRQQLLDCDYGPQEQINSNHGCTGGLADKGYGWVAMHGGLCLEEDYPFLSTLGVRNECRVLSCERSITVEGYKDVQRLDEAALQDAVAQQPVTVAVSAMQPHFQLYKDGVYDHPLSKDDPLDHTMVVIGYGTTRQGLTYWKLKNSWGTAWGIDGYMLMKRGVNMAGITTMPSYPIGVRHAKALEGLKNEEEESEKHPVPGMRHVIPQPEEYDGECHTPREGDIKLSSYPAGLVLMWYDGEWHTVCQENSNMAFARVACKMMGFQHVDNQATYSAPAEFPMVSSPHCIGHEDTMLDCRFDAVYANEQCSTYRNMLAMYVECSDGEMSNYTYHCGYKGPDGASIKREALPARAAPSAVEMSVHTPRAFGVAAVGALGLVVALVAFAAVRTVASSRASHTGQMA